MSEDSTLSQAATEQLKSVVDDNLSERLRKRERIGFLTIISVTSAVVSILATGVAFYRESQQEHHNFRLELTSLVEKLAEVSDTGAIRGDEYNIIAKLAYDTATKIEDQVSSPEFSEIADGLLNAGEGDKSLNFAELGASRATNFYEATWADRELGSVQFNILPNIPDDNGYLRAFNDFRKYHMNINDIGVKSDQAFTVINWASDLSIRGLCQDAKQKIPLYLMLSKSIIFSQDQDKIAREVDQANHAFSRCGIAPIQSGFPDSDAKLKTASGLNRPESVAK